MYFWRSEVRGEGFFFPLILLFSSSSPSSVLLLCFESPSFLFFILLQHFNLLSCTSSPRYLHSGLISFSFSLSLPYSAVFLLLHISFSSLFHSSITLVFALLLHSFLPIIPSDVQTLQFFPSSCPLLLFLTPPIFSISPPFSRSPSFYNKTWRATLFNYFPSSFSKRVRSIITQLGHSVLFSVK